MSPLHGIVLTAGLLATIDSTLSIYPHQLAYFNQLSGGLRTGETHLLHSNLDWGQSLLEVKQWMKKNPENYPVHVVYTGGFRPESIGLPTTSPHALSKLSHFHGEDPPGGWYFISKNCLHGNLATSHGVYVQLSEDLAMIRRLTHLHRHPDDNAMNVHRL